MPSDFIGRHWTGFEEPDLLRMKLTGLVTEAEARELNRLHFEYVQGRERIFYLIDLSELESIEPGARKEAGTGLERLPLGGLAIYSAPLKARVIAKLIFTAMNLFRRADSAKVPFEFVPTEEAARAWIAERRKLPLPAPVSSEPAFS